MRKQCVPGSTLLLCKGLGTRLMLQRTPYTHQECEVLLPQSVVEAVVSQRPLVEHVDEGGVCSAGADVGEVGAVGREGGWGRRLLGFRVQRSEYPRHNLFVYILAAVHINYIMKINSTPTPKKIFIKCRHFGYNAVAFMAIQNCMKALIISQKSYLSS